MDFTIPTWNRIEECDYYLKSHNISQTGQYTAKGVTYVQCNGVYTLKWNEMKWHEYTKAKWYIRE